MACRKYIILSIFCLSLMSVTPSFSKDEKEETLPLYKTITCIQFHRLNVISDIDKIIKIKYQIAESYLNEKANEDISPSMARLIVDKNIAFWCEIPIYYNHKLLSVAY